MDLARSTDAPPRSISASSSVMGGVTGGAALDLLAEIVDDPSAPVRHHVLDPQLVERVRTVQP